MNLHEQYIKERENLDIIKTGKGFITYRIEFPNCFISDYFVSKEFRQSGHGYFLADQVFDICKQAGIKDVFCQTDDNANGIELSKYTVENFGFESIMKEGSITTYKMGVSEWAE
jgi:GNAT superfamily N-acetyltransferase